MIEEKIQELYKEARKARERAYVPVTKNIKFGAALITRSGKIYAGCNMEEKGLVLTRHSEMHAIDKMVFERENDGDDIIIDVIVIAGDPPSVGLEEPIFPCALCRNHISQFSDDQTLVVAMDLKGNMIKKAFKDLLPKSSFKKFDI